MFTHIWTRGRKRVTPSLHENFRAVYTVILYSATVDGGILVIPANVAGLSTAEAQDALREARINQRVSLTSSKTKWNRQHSQSVRL